MNETKDSKVYLISWDDDNHEKLYYLDTNFLGCNFPKVIERALKLGSKYPPQI